MSAGFCYLVRADDTKNFSWRIFESLAFFEKMVDSGSSSKEFSQQPRPTVSVDFIHNNRINGVLDHKSGGKRKSKPRQDMDCYETPTAILTKSGRKVLPRNDVGRRSSSRKSMVAAYPNGEDKVAADLECLHIETPRKHERPKSALYDANSALTDQVHGFRKSRPRGSMIQKASQTVHKASETPEPVTPVITKRARAKKFSTPYATRSKFKQKINQEAARQEFEELLKDLADSDYKPSDDSYESSEESSDDMNVLPLNAPIRHSPKKSFNDSRRRTREKVSDISFHASEYFERQGHKSITSSNTLSKLKSDKFCRRELHKMLKTIKSSHAKALEELKQDCQRDYKRWMLALSEGYNVLLYGVGSKHEILLDFQATYLNERRTTVFVNGFFPGTTLKEIFEEIALGVVKLDSISSDPREAIAQIDQRLKPKSSDHLFILVSNIDGEVLRNDKTQSALAELAALPKVHMIASCDHINAPLMWDQKKISQFNFIWEDATCLTPYIIETSYENSRLIENTADSALASLRNVFRSLNSNSKSIFKILLDYQLEEGGSKNYFGMSFSTLYQKCREDFIVSADLILRTQLTEFLDHNLIKWKKDTDQLLILVDRTALEQFRAEIQ